MDTATSNAPPPSEPVCPDEQLVRDWANVGLARAEQRLTREAAFAVYLDATEAPS